MAKKVQIMDLKKSTSIFEKGPNWPVLKCWQYKIQRPNRHLYNLMKNSIAIILRRYFFGSGKVMLLKSKSLFMEHKMVHLHFWRRYYFYGWYFLFKVVPFFDKKETSVFKKSYLRVQTKHQMRVWWLPSVL